MAGEFLHAEGFAQLLHHRLPECVGVAVLALLEGVEAELLGVLCAQFQQRKLVTPGRDVEIHPVYAHVGPEGDNHLPGELSEFCLYLGDEAAQHRFLLLFDLHFESQVEALYDGSAPYSEEVAEGLGAVEYQREYIQVAVFVGSYDRLGIMLLEGFHTCLAELGRLEIQLFRGLQHGRLVFGNDLAHSAFQQMHDFFNPTVVFFFRNLAHAAAQAPAYVIVEAGAVFAAQDGVGVDFEPAAAQRPVAPEEFEQAPCVHY